MKRETILARKRETLRQLCDLQRDEAADLWVTVQQPPRFANIVSGAWSFLKDHPGLMTAALATGASALGKRSRFAARLVSLLPLARTGLNLVQKFQRSSR